VLFGVDEVFLPVCRVACGEFGSMEDEEDILGIARFCCLGEVEASGDDLLIIDHHDLVVGDLVRGIDEGRDTLVDEVSRPGIPLRSLAFVQNHPNIDAAMLGIDQGLRDRNGSETIGLN